MVKIEQQQAILGFATALATARKRFEELQHENEPDTFGQLCELLDDVEQRIFEHKDAFGVANAKFQLGCEEFVLLSNTIAMHMLQQTASLASSSSLPHDLKLCGKLLQKAEQHTRRAGYLRSVQSHSEEPDEGEGHVNRRLEFRLICFNNLACYYKEVAKPLAALGFLEKALKIQLKQVALAANTDDDQQQTTTGHATALTHLNLCAVLSQLQRHPAAAEHARSSIALLTAIQCSGHHSNDRLALVAHFNLGVELEHLSDFDAALRSYQAALQIAKAHGITRKESDLVRTMEEIVREPKYGRKGVPVSLRSRLVSPYHRPLSPRSLRQASAQLS